MPNQKLDIKQWQRRKGATDARIAMLLAEANQRAESAFDAFFALLPKLLTREECRALDEAWAAGDDAPADIWAKVCADTAAMALWDDSARSAWLLSGIAHNMIPSEHFVFAQTGGSMVGPNGEK
jgi:hypothetical protein